MLVAEGRLTPATIDPAVLRVLPREPLDGVNVAVHLATAQVLTAELGAH